MSAETVAVPVAPPPSRKKRMTKVFAWIAGIVILLVVLDLLGVDVIGWLRDLWEQVKDMPTGYLAAAATFQTAQTLFAALSYYGILKFAYKDEVQFWQIAAAYAVGVALNGFLPANLGTFCTLVMFVAIIPSCNIAGAIGAYVVQKIFFTIAGTLRLPLHVPERARCVRRQLWRKPQGIPLAHDPDRLPGSGADH